MEPRFVEVEMHLVTGLLLAGLLGKKSKETKGKSPLLHTHGPIETAHVLPGRVRFRIESLKGDIERSRMLANQLSKIGGIESVETNELSGSILIRHDATTLEPDLLLAAIVRLLGLERQMQRARVPVVARGIGDAADALNDAFYVQTRGLVDLWTAIPIVLAVLGANKVRAQGLAALPTGFTLLWWAYLALVRRRRAEGG